MTQPTTNKKGSPPKFEIKPPAKIPRHHLSPSEAKAQDILHEHQSKLLEKIHAGIASPEDHLRFSQVRERLNQITTAALAKVAATDEQQPAKFRKQAKNEESKTDIIHKVQHLGEPLTVLENPSHGAIRNWLRNLKSESYDKPMLIGLVHHNGSIFVSEGWLSSTREPVLHAALYKTMGGSGNLPATHRFLLGLDKNQEPHVSAYADPAGQPEHLKNWANSQGLTVNIENDPQYEIRHADLEDIGHLEKLGIKSPHHLLQVLGAPTRFPIDRYRLKILDPNRTRVAVTSPHYDLSREINHKNKSVYNNYIEVSNKGNGLGSEILHSQIHGLTGLGYRKIEAYGGKGNGMVGFYVLPLHGFNGDFNDVEQNYRLPKEYRGVKDLHELFRRPGGRSYWKHQGWGKELEFDLTPGSFHHQLHEAYMQEKENRPVENEVTNNKFESRKPIGEEIDLAPWEEEALERAWKRFENKGYPPPSQPIGDPTVPPISPFDTERNIQLPSVSPHWLLPPVNVSEVRPLLEAEIPPPAENQLVVDTIVANEIKSRDTDGGKWVTTISPEEIRHTLVENPKKNKKKKKGKKPTETIPHTAKIDIDHLSPEQRKHQDILLQRQHKLLEKINEGKASHEEHQEFSQIRDRLNELHHHAKRFKEDKELREKYQTERVNKERSSKKAGEVKPEELDERSIRDREQQELLKLKAQRGQELTDELSTNRQICSNCGYSTITCGKCPFCLVEQE